MDCLKEQKFTILLLISNLFLLLLLISTLVVSNLDNNIGCQCIENEAEISSGNILDFPPAASQTLAQNNLNGRLPKNCEEVKIAGNKISGVYKIYRDQHDNCSEHESIKEVFCDLTTDGGGWTVIQRRTNSTQDFFLPFEKYETGFGSLKDSFWLGLDTISSLTLETDHELRIELTDWDGDEVIARYSHFRVSSTSQNYRLSVCGYSGDAGDSFSSHNGHDFSAKDKDDNNQCSKTWMGAWWYNDRPNELCYESNLNGVYNGTSHTTIAWKAWRGFGYSLKRVEMKMRRLDFQCFRNGQT